MFKPGIISYPNGTVLHFNGHPTLANNIIYYHKADVSLSYPDVTGNGHNGTISGPTFTTSGKIFGAYDYSGTAQNITLVDATAFDHSGAFTISYWVKYDVNGNYEFLMYRGDTLTQNLYYLLKLVTSNKMAFVIFSSGSFVQIDSNSGLTAGNWYHIVARRNSSNLMEMFINGVKQTANGTKAGNTNPVGTASYHIGTDRTNAFGTNGIIDEGAEWDRALTDTEVIDLYNSGNGLQY